MRHSRSGRVGEGPASTPPPSTAGVRALDGGGWHRVRCDCRAVVKGVVGMFDLDRAIRQRHSARMFLLNQAVPRQLLDEALALAQCAPSNSNIQPWHVVFASGSARDRLVAALLEEARRRPPNIPPLPESFQHYRRELGAQVY